jgi:hypothetical protein
MNFEARAVMNSEAVPVYRQRNIFETIAMGLSLGCLAHCLALPLILASLPAWSAWFDVPEAFHQWVLLAAAPLGLWMLIDGYRLHRGVRQMLLGVTGLVLMASALMFEESPIETAATAAGAATLAIAHALNWRSRARLCRH